MTTSVENVLLSNLPVTAAEARRAVAKRSAKSPPCAVRLSAVARREGSAPLPDTRAQAADTVLLCLSPMHRLTDASPFVRHAASIQDENPLPRLKGGGFGTPARFSDASFGGAPPKKTYGARQRFPPSRTGFSGPIEAAYAFCCWLYETAQ